MPRPQQPPDNQRQLMIKTKVCQRLIKEVAYYEREVKENETKLREMKEDANKDPYDVKKFEEVLGESYMMVPDSGKRLQRAVEELSVFLRDNDQEVDHSGEWYSAARTILKEQQREEVAAESANNDDDDEHGKPPETKVEGLAAGEAF